MIEYVDAQKWYMTFCLNAAPISSRVRFLLLSCQVKKILKFLNFVLEWPSFFPLEVT